MSVEAATYLSQLDPTLPRSTDVRSEGDDHINLVKSTLKAQFPNFTANAITATCADLTAVTGAGGTGATALRVLTQPIGDSSTLAASTALVDAKVAAAALTSTLPGQTGNAGKYVTTDGTNASWGSLPTNYAWAASQAFNTVWGGINSSNS